MHCSLCVLYPTTAQRHTEKSTVLLLQIDYFHLSLSLSWLVPILLFATSEAWGNQRITEKAQPLVTSIIPLCCVVPDTVNDNQWTNNNLAGLIMRTMLTQQLVIHRSICQYCTAEQRVVLSSWKRNNSVYYNINIKSGFIRKLHNFSIDSKSMMLYFERAKFFRLKFVYPTDTYPPSFQI